MSSYSAILEACEVTVMAGPACLVSNADLRLAPGEVVGLLGANGAGKSSFLKACSGELAPVTGSIRLNGKEIRSLPAVKLASSRAVVAQSSDLSFPFTAREVVLLGATVPGFGHRSERLEAIARTAMEDVGVAHLAGRSFLLLSGGERQRVHIARALCQLAVVHPLRTDPPLLLLDEPTSSLDLAHQRLVLSRLRRLAAEGGAVLAVLHDVNLAAAYCDRLLIMKAGRVLAGGTPKDVIVSSVLSEAYGCSVDANRPPPGRIPFALPVTSTPTLPGEA